MRPIGRLWGLAALAVLTAASLAPAGAALANDSSAEVRAGGLVLQRNAAVAMLSEDLYISRREIRVRYVYRNITAAPVTLTIAFPLPDRKPWDGGGDRGYPRDFLPDERINEGPDFMGFTTTVDGQPASLQPRLSAHVGGRDVTARLRTLNLLVAPDGPLANERIGALPEARRAALRREGLLGTDGEPNAPAWTLKTAFLRQQTFPPGRDVVVTHRYSTGAGGSVGSALGMGGEYEREVRRKYCVDDAFMATARRTMGAGGGNVGLSASETWVSYVLRTGANWARPIGRFRLEVDKEDPNVLVSWCGTGVRRLSPTRFEMTRTDFTPDRDLELLFLVPYPKDR